MGRTVYQPPAGSSYNIAALLRGESDCYAESISQLIGERRPAAQRIPGGAYLPSRRFARALGVGAAASAGNIVNGNALLGVADAARPATVLEAAGAQRLELVAEGAINLPVWEPGAGGWVPEYGVAPQLASSVRSITASGRMAAARLALSRRLLLQAEEAEASILREVQAAVAAVIEGGIIAGSGSNNEPLGVLATPGIGSETFAAALPTYAELTKMIEKAADADASLAASSWLLNTKDLAGLLAAQRGTAGPGIIEWDGAAHRIAGFQLLPTRHLPEGKVLFGDFSNVTLAYWGEPQITIDRISNGKSLSGAVDVVIHNLVDLMIAHPAQIVVGSA